MKIKFTNIDTTNPEPFNPEASGPNTYQTIRIHTHIYSSPHSFEIPGLYYPSFGVSEVIDKVECVVVSRGVTDFEYMNRVG
jgi:hypothetical protein